MQSASRTNSTFDDVNKPPRHLPLPVRLTNQNSRRLHDRSKRQSPIHNQQSTWYWHSVLYTKTTDRQPRQQLWTDIEKIKISNSVPCAETLLFFKNISRLGCTIIRSFPFIVNKWEKNSSNLEIAQIIMSSFTETFQTYLLAFLNKIKCIDAPSRKKWNEEKCSACSSPIDKLRQGAKYLKCISRCKLKASVNVCGQLRLEFTSALTQWQISAGVVMFVVEFLEITNSESIRRLILPSVVSFVPESMRQSHEGQRSIRNHIYVKGQHKPYYMTQHLL